MSKQQIIVGSLTNKSIAMDALFTDFAVLEKVMERSVTSALESVELTYFKLWDNSVKRTVSEMETKFGVKYPKTVARFVQEYKKDAEEFNKKTMPEFLFSAANSARNVDEFKTLYVPLAQHENGLFLLAGDVDDNSINISEHIKAKHLLVCKLHTDEKNMATLEALKNDEDGEHAVYTKLSLPE